MRKSLTKEKRKTDFLEIGERKVRKRDLSPRSLLLLRIDRISDFSNSATTERRAHYPLHGFVSRIFSRAHILFGKIIPEIYLN